MHPTTDGIEVMRRVHLVELDVWALCVLVSAAVSLSTLGAEFPARTLALQGEAVALASAVVLAGLSALRLLGVPLFGLGRPRHPAIAASIAWITLRLSFGVPIFLFLLVAAAAGFAA